MKSPLCILVLLVWGSTASGQPIRIDDMVFDREDVRRLAGPASAPGLLDYSALVWVDGTLPIEFAPTISAARRVQFYAGCSLWTASARVACAPHADEATYVLVKDESDDGCWSYVGSGRQPGHRQLNLGKGCWVQSVIVHELGHMLGMMHEHQRVDRDLYIDVFPENAVPGYEYAFARVANLGDGPYDLLSVMHYGSWAFARQGLSTIEPKTPNAHLRRLMGSANTPTRLDGEGMARLYGSTEVTPSIVLAITRPTNPVTLTWTRTLVTGANTLLAGSRPGAADIAVIPLGSEDATVSGEAPFDVPVYVRVQSGAVVSNEVLLRAVLLLDQPQVSGTTVRLSWEGSNAVRLVARNPSGLVLAVVPLRGRSVEFSGVPAGKYLVDLQVGSTTSNAVAVVVP